ncbi:MAG: zinc-dependent metalloprotease family protein, partial [bacterium]
QQALFNIAELLFQRQTGVSFNVTSQWVCTTVAACPYGGDSANQWLDAFIDRWEATTTEAIHEVGHLLSGMDLQPSLVGLAAGLVGTSTGYSLSEFAVVNTEGSFLSYTTITHELGHNFDARHEFADVIPKLPGPAATQNVSPVATLMWPGKLIRFQFSDGGLDPAHNNLARIIAMANQQLPPP